MIIHPWVQHTRKSRRKGLFRPKDTGDENSAE